MKAKKKTEAFAADPHSVTPFKRLLVIGCGGAGKSTLAVELGRVTGLPVIHLDKLYWLPGWEHLSGEKFDTLLAAELAKDRWIMDGNFDRTLPERLRWCDSLVLLDYPTAVCAAGVVKRRIMYHGRSRSSMTEGCNERLDMEFLRWVFGYRRTKLPGYIELLRQAAERPNPPQIYFLKNRKQTRRWLKTVRAAFLK